MNSKSNFRISFPSAMKTNTTNTRDFLATLRIGILDSQLVLILALALGASPASGAAATGKSFATPEDAVAALSAATRSSDSEALRVIFGPAAAEIENPDRVQAANEFRAFSEALSQSKRIVRESDSRCILEVGADFWPFPVPLLKRDGQWYFDTEAGKDEVLSRRIGRNELDTLRVVRACVEAQREYASRDRDGDEVLEFTPRFLSSVDTKDGLYWPPDLDGEISPLGPLVAYAQVEGYSRKSSATNSEPEPFHGYLFRMLTRQSRHAPGGKHDYVINGNMIAGFAFVAWPAEYGESGVMTFIVNQQGRVYQRDLGADTSKLARRMKAYDPDPGWQLSPD